MSDLTRNLEAFNPYTEFNITVDDSDYCNHCGVELGNNYILGKSYTVAAALRFCSPNCRNKYEQEELF